MQLSIVSLAVPIKTTVKQKWDFGRRNEESRSMNEDISLPMISV